MKGNDDYRNPFSRFFYVLFYSKTITFKNSDILCDSK